MKEFKGCKGEWKHHKPHGYQHSVGGWIQSEKGKVCDVTGLEVGRETAFANANLIAAAPDLLEACLRARNQFYAAGYDAKAGSMNPAECLLAQLNAAISKALGEE